MFHTHTQLITHISSHHKPHLTQLHLTNNSSRTSHLTTTSSVPVSLLCLLAVNGLSKGHTPLVHIGTFYPLGLPAVFAAGGWPQLNAPPPATLMMTTLHEHAFIQGEIILVLPAFIIAAVMWCWITLSSIVAAGSAGGCWERHVWLPAGSKGNPRCS